MEITWPENTKDVTDKIREAIGRDVTFVIVASSNPCTVCSLDPVTNTSTDSFCLVCSGDYWIPVYEDEIVNAHITWGGVDQLGWVTGGQLFEGDCRIGISYSQENLNIIDKTEYVVVDGRILQIKNKIFRGVPEINRILINFIEKGKE